MLKIKELLKGSHAAMVVAGLVIAGVVSAAVVTYLANDVVVDNTVASPIKMSVNEGRNGASTGNISLSINSYGGETYSYTTVSENQSKVDVEGYAVTVIEQTAGGNLTGHEFTEIIAEAKIDSPDTHTILDDMYVVHTDGTLEQLISKNWDNPKLVTTLCYDLADYAASIPQPHARCVNGIANDVAIKGIVKSLETTWVVSTFTLNPGTIGTYTVKGQFVNDLAKYAVEEYAK